MGPWVVRWLARADGSGVPRCGIINVEVPTRARAPAHWCLSWALVAPAPSCGHWMGFDVVVFDEVMVVLRCLLYETSNVMVMVHTRVLCQCGTGGFVAGIPQLGSSPVGLGCTVGVSMVEFGPGDRQKQMAT